jgi:hypothetical protein
MSEVMTAEAAYRKEVLLSYDALLLYRTFFTTPEDCCVECVAPADACEEYVQIRRNMDLSREALMEYCGYTVDDVHELTDNSVINVLIYGLKEETVQFEEKFLEKYSF